LRSLVTTQLEKGQAFVMVRDPSSITYGVKLNARYTGNPQHDEFVRVFVAALNAVAQLFEASYEPAGLPNGLWGQIYPRDDKGMPTVSGCGKYGVRLHFRGEWRLVIVDDRFELT
jgi:hypothetical protein